MDTASVVEFQSVPLIFVAMTSYKFVVTVFLCGILTSNVKLFAQTADLPGPEMVHRDALRDSYRIEQEIRQFRQQPSRIAIGSPQPPPFLDDKSDEKILNLNSVIFDNPPRSISRRELDAIAQRYVSMGQVSLRDLYEMLAEIDRLFDDRHVLGRAVLPVQDIEDGIVRVQIIEGRFGPYTVTTKRQPFFPEFSSKNLLPVERLAGKSFVERQFRFRPGSVANIRNLEEEILRFNRTHRTQLIAELEPGNELGFSNLKLTAVVPRPISGGYYCDSSGRESSGRIRNGGFVHLQSAFGFDESFYCSYDKTDGTSYLTMFGDIPLTRFGTSFEMGYDYGTPKTIYGPFADLNITGTSTRYRPAVRQLIRNTKDNKTDFSFQIETFSSETLFDDFVNYREQVAGYTLGVSDIYRTKKTVRFASLAWQLGKAGVGANPIFDDFTWKSYHILHGSMTKVWYPNKNWTFLAKGNAQWGLSRLSQSRVFQIGGMATVRGAPEGLMTGDSGYLLSLEGRRVLWNWRNRGAVEAFGFFDHGGTFNRVYPVDDYPSDYLFSLGTGLNMNWGRYLSATIGYGQPLFTAESHRADYRDKLRHGNGYFTSRAQF